MERLHETRTPSLCLASKVKGVVPSPGMSQRRMKMMAVLPFCARWLLLSPLHTHTFLPVLIRVLRFHSLSIETSLPLALFISVLVFCLSPLFVARHGFLCAPHPPPTHSPRYSSTCP